MGHRMSAPTREQRLDALRARYRRRRHALLIVALCLTATAALSGAMQAPRQLLAQVLGAGLPGPLEIVPRQVPWSGVLELDGGPVNDPALPLQVSLIALDGGAQWTENLVASVSDGGFWVELGDTTPIPAAVLANNVVDLDVRVGAGLAQLPRQRLESVPFALRSGDVIAASRTVNVGAGGQFATLAEAFSWLRTKVVRGAVTLQLANGTYALPAGGLRFDHPDAIRVHILGNVTDPTQVVVNASDQGLTIGSSLYEIGGIRLVGSGAVGTVGLTFTDHVQGFPHDLQIAGFETPLQVTGGARLYFSYVNLTGLGVGSGSCFDVNHDSHALGGPLTVASCQVGIRSSDRSSLSLIGGSISNVAEGVFATRASLVALDTAAQIADAGIAEHATVHSFINTSQAVTFTNVAVEKDPPVNTVGNGNSYIAQ